MPPAIGKAEPIGIGLSPSESSPNTPKLSPRGRMSWFRAPSGRASMRRTAYPNLSKSFPWHVSIDDLRVVAELFKDKQLTFVHFLEQRLKAASVETLHQHDEIAHVGLYNKINHYHDLPVRGMDEITFDASYLKDIDEYFAAKSAGESPDAPSQNLPTAIGALVRTLEESQLPGRFEAGSIILSMNDAGRQEFEATLSVIAGGQAEGKQRTIRLPFVSESYGITISNTRRCLSW
jgi:hypothetical protein